MYPRLIDDPERLHRIAATNGTPVWIYQADIIAQRVAQLAPFDVIRFAQKACSNTHILRLLRGLGVRVDAVSAGEIGRALAAGYGASEIVFTCDVFDRHSLGLVVEHGIEVNAGSIDMLEQLGAASPGHRVWLRINPGFGHGHSAKTNTGGENSKHGIWHGDLALALATLRRQRLRLVGLHMHIGSGADYDHLLKVCTAMVDMVRGAGVDLESISAGGGLAIPYREGEAPVDTRHYFQLWDAARKEIEGFLGHAVKLEIEPGRFLVAEAGVLMAEVRATKMAGANRFVLVDAGFNDLARPAMYGSYHGISVLGPDGRVKDRSGAVPAIVAGPLCESGDVFTQTGDGVVAAVPLPPVDVGDTVVFHDAGAYGASMSSCYNSRPLAAEVLIDGGEERLIRRRQRLDELLALEGVGERA